MKRITDHEISRFANRVEAIEDSVSMVNGGLRNKMQLSSDPGGRWGVAENSIEQSVFRHIQSLVFTFLQCAEHLSPFNSQLSF